MPTEKRHWSRGTVFQGSARKRAAAARKSAAIAAGADVGREVRLLGLGVAFHSLEHRSEDRVDLGRRAADDLDLRLPRTQRLGELGRRDADAVRRVRPAKHRLLDGAAQALAGQLDQFAGLADDVTEHRALRAHPEERLGAVRLSIPVT